MADGDAAAETYTLTLTARQRLLLRAVLNEASLKDLREGMALLGLTDVDESELDTLWHRLQFSKTSETVAETLSKLSTAQDVVIYSGAVQAAVGRELSARENDS